MTSTNQEMGRAGRKRLEMRERLYQAAVALFVERGYDATTMTDIAERADTARGTAFNHFPTKSDFAFEWTHRRSLEATRLMDDALASNEGAIERVRAYFAQLASITERDREVTTQMVRGWLRAAGPVHDAPWLAHDLTPWIQAGQESGDVSATIDPAAAAELLRDAYLGAQFRWLRESSDTPGRLTADLVQTVDLVLRGLVDRPT